MGLRPKKVNEVVAIEKSGEPVGESEGAEALAGLSDRQRRAAELLSMGWGVTSVAESVSVTPTTIRVWLDQPAFRLAIAYLLRIQWVATQNRITNLATEAIDFLAQTLADQERPTRDRLKAAEILLKLATEPVFRPNMAASRERIEREIKAGY